MFLALSIFRVAGGLVVRFVRPLMSVRWSVRVAANGSGLCEVAENRSEKFRFRRHVAKANFYLLIYEKKPIKLAFADYEAQSFNLDVTPPFCKTLVMCCAFSRVESLSWSFLFSLVNNRLLKDVLVRDVGQMF